jgi:alkanesulfonate monooxygenase SsuD/methylene tetrahydromethanopterin reductase-like flavin-dependent oxidoreductase (luciferase family)
MRACITALRALLAGETVTFGRTSGRLTYASRRRIPVLMAASGPKATELAGEIADGVLLSVGFHPRICDAAGLTLPRLDIPPAVHAIYPDLSHARDWEQAIAATSFVPDDVIAQLCETFGLVGTAEHCAQRIVEMTKAGVTNLYVQALQTFVGPEQEMRTFRDEVFPRLETAGYR